MLCRCIGFFLEFTKLLNDKACSVNKMNSVLLG
jgi:hypothetical protein